MGCRPLFRPSSPGSRSGLSSTLRDRGPHRRPGLPSVVGMPEPFVIQPRLSAASAQRPSTPAASRAPADQPAATTPPRSPSVLARHPALAAISVYLDDPLVTDLFINGGGGLFVDRGTGAVPVSGW